MAQMSGLRDLGGGSRPHHPALIRTAERPSPYLNGVSRPGAPEAPLVVEFVGLTESEQRAALNGFPGGKRFLLAARAT